jgi:Mor family transcriptional regulator
VLEREIALDQTTAKPKKIWFYFIQRRELIADSKKNRGKADRSRVSGIQRSEVSHVARKYGVSAETVRSVIKRVGNSRKKVYAALDKM